MRTPPFDPVVDVSKIQDLCVENDVEYLGLFGSYARGDFSEDSDVDLLVRFSKPKSLLTLVRIEREFAERLGKPVDLITEASVNRHLKERIYADVKSLYEASR